MTLPESAAAILDHLDGQVALMPPSPLREKLKRLLTTRRAPLLRLVQTMLQREREPLYWIEQQGLTAAQRRALPQDLAQLQKDLQRVHVGPAPAEEELLTAYDRGYLQGLALQEVRAVRLSLGLSRRGEDREAIAILWQQGQTGDWTARLDGWLTGRPQAPRLVQVLAQVANDLERGHVHPRELGEALVLDHRKASSA